MDKPIILCCSTIRGRVIIPLDVIDRIEENSTDAFTTYIKTKAGNEINVEENVDAILLKLENVANIVYPSNEEV